METKTIEERAKGWAYRYPMTPDGYLTESDMRAVATNSYIQGTTEQKAIDIDKACDWLKGHINEYIAVGNTDFGKPYNIDLCSEGLFGDFSKVMEK